MTDTILVVDDEPAIIRALSAALEAREYRVVQAHTGLEAIDRAAVDGPALVILDLGLPDIDGIDVLKRIRQWSQMPIIVLTAEGAEDRKIEALDGGADDYVTKPFSVPELLARVRVALRHRSAATTTPDESVYEVGDIRIDVARHTVTANGQAVDLTPKEFGFLAVLARHPGRVISHRMILEEVWGKGYGTETQYLRVYASQIRKKLNEDLAKPRLITEPGVGYRLVDPDD